MDLLVYHNTIKKTLQEHVPSEICFLGKGRMIITEHVQSVHLQLQGRTLHAGSAMDRLAGKVHIPTNRLISITYCLLQAFDVTDFCSLSSKL
jgi:hypothetical protein